MPKLDMDMFDSPPTVGDKVTVTGEVKSINKKNGDVEVTYDRVEVTDRVDTDEEIEDENTVDGALNAFMRSQTQSKEEEME